MVYLIDDKKERQEKDYNWSSNRLKNYVDILQPIYSLKELQENNVKIFKESKVILYHESFIDKSILSDEAAQKRTELTKYAKREGKYLVYFSGGSDTRLLDGNIAYISDSILYQNLHFFLRAYEKGDLNIGYLIYGSDPTLEEKLKGKLTELIHETESEEVKEVAGKQNLFLRPLDDFISNPILNSNNETLWEASDEYLTKFIEEKLKENHFDNIFIPLCFGDTLSDFNGLKLALYIRCTHTINQYSNLYIYGFVKFSFLVNHLYFDILKTKNVKLIEFSKKAIYTAASASKNKILGHELRQEIAKIKLSHPKSYNDNHAITNEWAIYRWAKTINISDERIQVIESKIENNLYFKYLKTIYPISEAETIDKKKLNISFSGAPKILYIDDEAEKGWGEIFAHILEDINELYFDYLLEDFKNITQNKLIESSIKKIKDDDIDIVLLDFRLLPCDFNTENIVGVTGVKLLKEIKKLNPGIQVIIFSATNKIWNLQKLQEYGADGFILKESPENSSDKNFTKDSIKSLEDSIAKGIEMLFLKGIYLKLGLISKQLKSVAFEDDTDFDTFLLKQTKNIDLIYKSTQLINLKEPSTLDIVFLSCYNFLEEFKNYYVNEANYKMIIGIDQFEMNRYSCYKGKITNNGPFVRNDRYDNPSWFNSLAGIFLDYFEVCELNDALIIDLLSVKDNRNYYIHGAKKKFNEMELKMIINLMIKITAKMKE
jgi:CheY-like chemotaxis protein